MRSPIVVRGLMLAIWATLPPSLPTSLSAQEAGHSQLPVRRVVIHKYGMAYVERPGDVTGLSSGDLSFRKDEMTDILKSLSVNMEGGAVARVRFSTDKRLDKKRKPSPFRIHDGQDTTPRWTTQPGLHNSNQTTSGLPGRFTSSQPGASGRPDRLKLPYVFAI